MAGPRVAVAAVAYQRAHRGRNGSTQSSHNWLCHGIPGECFAPVEPTVSTSAFVKTSRGLVSPRERRRIHSAQRRA
jgi:hypothetical protein